MLTDQQVQAYRSQYGLDSGSSGSPQISNSAPPSNPNWYQDLRSSQAKEQQQKTQAQQPQGQSMGQALLDPIKGGLHEIANDTSQAFQGGLQQGREGVAQIGKGGSNPLSAAGNLISGVGKVGAGFIQSAFSPAAAAMKPIGNAVNYAADKISNNPTVQKFAQSPVGQKTANVAGDVANYAIIAGTVGGAMDTPNIVNKANEGLNTTVGGAIDAGNKVVDVASGIKNKVASGLENKYVAQSQNEWAKPTTVTKPAYNNATDIFNKATKQGNNIPETLVKNNIKLSDNVNNGAYATADTAAKIRADAGKMSSDMLRPSLQMADYSTPKTPVSDILTKTVEDIKNSKGVTSGDMQTQIAKATKEAQALQKQYPNGMSLTDMHDNKITYTQNGGFSPVKDPNVNNIASVNRAFGRTLDGLVQSKVPEGVPVKEFNTELQKQYQAANYLDALNGKKVPQSIGSKIANTTSKVVGAAVGHGLGGGILGGVGGYHIGGMIESMFENLSNPVKSAFLDNLAKTNPEAFQAVQKYMGAEQVSQLTRKALPAPDYIEGQAKTPPQGSAIKVMPAEKGLPGRNPKTGRMFRTYSSTPK